MNPFFDAADQMPRAAAYALVIAFSIVLIFGFIVRKALGPPSGPRLSDRRAARKRDRELTSEGWESIGNGRLYVKPLSPPDKIRREDSEHCRPTPSAAEAGQFHYSTSTTSPFSAPSDQLIQVTVGEYKLWTSEAGRLHDALEDSRARHKRATAHVRELKLELDGTFRSADVAAHVEFLNDSIGKLNDEIAGLKKELGRTLSHSNRMMFSIVDVQKAVDTMAKVAGGDTAAKATQ